MLKERLPESQLLVQDRGMTEAAREAFLAQFSASNRETLVGLAVMGGIFGEGIDLVGERLIGAVVIGVGIPQLGRHRREGLATTGADQVFRRPGVLDYRTTARAFGVHTGRCPQTVINLTTFHIRPPPAVRSY